ncbi:MAG: hypothetical protein EBR82_42985 [Caulobacteraceae bacterium]|nr:hypothetical protein [Caulobacteraceae bacterium]
MRQLQGIVPTNRKTLDEISGKNIPTKHAHPACDPRRKRVFCGHGQEGWKQGDAGQIAGDCQGPAGEGGEGFGSAEKPAEFSKKMLTTETASVLPRRMSQLNTIFSARDGKSENNFVAATERKLPSEADKARKVQAMVANLAAQKTEWLREFNCNEIVRGWSGLR